MTYDCYDIHVGIQQDVTDGLNFSLCLKAAIINVSIMSMDQNIKCTKETEGKVMVSCSISLQASEVFHQSHFRVCCQSLFNPILVRNLGRLCVNHKEP